MDDDRAEPVQLQEPGHREPLRPEAVLRAAGSGILALDTAGRTVWVNPAAATIVGREQQELVGLGVHEVVHVAAPRAEQHLPASCPLVQTLRDGGVHRREDTFRRPGGAGVPVRYTATPVQEDGRTVGAVVVVEDVTERRATEQRDRFLAGLERALQPLEDPDAIMALVARRLGEHLLVDRCAYAEVEQDEDHFTITGDFARGMAGISGRFAMSAFGTEALRLMRAGEPYVVVDAHSDERVTEADLVAYRQTSIRAVVSVPVMKTGRFAAGMAVHQASPRRWTEPEIELVTTVVNRCWESLERARAVRALRASEERYRLLHRAEQQVAEVLQRSLLPAELPGLARVGAAARYMPAAAHGRAGGDWYDLLPVDGSVVALAVGDVVGQGPAAAAVMGQLRSALAGYLLDDHGPAAALERLDRFARRVEGAAGSTCACLTLDWRTGELRWALAGHPPPLLVEAGGVRFLPDGAGAVLGVAERPPFQEASATIPAGTSVVLYTDGLVERRDEVIDTGLRELARATEAVGDRAPDALAAALIEEVLGEDGPPDDIALVVVRLIPEPLCERLPAAATSMRRMRRSVESWAALAGLPDEYVDDLQLALGEAATNAAEHAYPAGEGEFDYEVARADDGRVLVRVCDRGSWRPAPSDSGHRGHGLRVIRGLAVEFTLDRGPTGTDVRFALPAPLPGAPGEHRAADRPGRAPLARPPGGARTAAGDTAGDTAAASVHVTGPRPGTRVAQVSGDLDLTGVSVARAELLALVTAPGVTEVVVDVRGVGYLSSAGVALLAEASTAAVGGGTALSVVVTAGSAAARILTLTGLDTALPVDTRPPQGAPHAAGTPAGGGGP